MTTKKKFTVYVTATNKYTSEIIADNLIQAIEIAESITEDQLWKLPGKVIESEKIITGVFS